MNRLYPRSKILDYIIIFRIFGQYRYQTVNFIAYLEKMNYKASTAKSYIWFEFQNESDGYPRYN